MRKDYPTARRHVLKAPKAWLLQVPKDSEHTVVNIGPSHPAMHGTFRVQALMDGETIVDAEAEIGYMHRNFEKMAEDRTYWQIIPYTDRLNYCSSFMNGHGWALAVEKLLGVPAPPRAEAIRVILSEFSRIMDHFVCIGDQHRRPRRHHALLLCCSACARRSTTCSRPAAARASPSPTCASAAWPTTCPPTSRTAAARLVESVREATARGGQAAHPQRDLREPLQGRGRDVRGRRARPTAGSGRACAAPASPTTSARTIPTPATSSTTSTCRWAPSGDCYDRYLVRMEEIRQSLRIIEQALAKLPGGPVIVDDKRVALPPKAEVYSNIEALMNHFKLVYEGILPPAGEVYGYTEGGQRRARLLHRERRQEVSRGA